MAIRSKADQKLLQLATFLRAAGIDPVALLEDELRAEEFYERRLRPTPSSLAAAIRENSAISSPDVFDSPTYRRRLLQIRVQAEGGPLSADSPEPETSSWATVEEARAHLERIGQALSFTTPRPAHRPREAASGWEQVGEPVKGQKVEQRSEDLKANVALYLDRLQKADRLTRGLTTAEDIAATLRTVKSLPPDFEPPLTKALMALRDQKKQKLSKGENLTVKDAAVLLAYEKALTPANKKWARSMANALRMRKT